jgi:hypothetical protein
MESGVHGDLERARNARVAALESALAEFGVEPDAATAPRRSRRRSLPVLGLVAGLLATLCAAAFGAFLAPDVAPDRQAPAPDNANHCMDTFFPYHSGCWELPINPSPSDGATVGSSPTLSVDAQTTGGAGGAWNVDWQLCPTSACASTLQTTTTCCPGHGATTTWTPTALANGTYWWRVREWESSFSNTSGWTGPWSFTIGAGGGGPPNAPSALAQYRSDGVTAIATAAWTTQNTVVLKFNVSDPDASQTLTPWVEVRTTNSFSIACGSSSAFTYSGTNVSAPTAGTNYLATVTVAGLPDQSTYYWRACAKDQNGNVSSWTARAGAPDFRLDAGVPNNPAQSGIYDLSSTWTLDKDATSNTTALSMSWDPGADSASGVLNYDACFSTVNTTCTAIAGTAMIGANTTRQASATASPPMTNGTTYYSCVRTRDNQAWVSAWQCSDGFTISTGGMAPTVTLISPANGATVNSDTPIVQARYDDPEATSGMVRVEFCATNAASPWSVNCASGYRTVQTAPDGVMSGATASLAPNVILPQGTNYWRAQSVDAQGLSSAWSASRSIIVDSIPPTPSPTVTLRRRGVGRIDVTYTPSTDTQSAVDYNVMAYNLATGLWEPVCTGTTSLTCIKTGLGGTELFLARVQACDASNNCTEWTVAGGISNSGYLFRNLAATNLNNVQSRKAVLGAPGSIDTTTTGILLPGGGAAARVGSFPLRYNTIVGATVALDTTPPIDPQSTTSGWGWVVDDVEGKSLAAGDIEVYVTTIPVAGATGTGVGTIRCRAWKALTNGTTSITSTTYIGEGYGDITDVMTAGGAGMASSTCYVPNTAQLNFATNEVLYVEPILEASVAGTAGDAYRLVYNDASSSINIPPPGSPPSTPTLISPANAAVTSTTPTLTAQYAHPSAVPGLIEMQYSTDPTFTVGVYGTATATVNNLNTASSSTISLAPGTVYYWRARGVDQNGLYSAWTVGPRSFTVSTKPNEPTPTAPADGVTLTPGAKTFTASAFSDPNGVADAHYASEWVIIPLGGSWASPAYTSGVTTTSKTSWTSPALPDGSYEWRVRYQDNFGMWSDWSGTTPANQRTFVISSGTLTLSSSASSFALGLQATGIDDFGSVTLTAVATNPTGYTLHASDESDTEGMFCSCGTNVPDWTGTNATPTVWTSGTAGFIGMTVRSAPVSRLAKWGTGTGTAENDVVNNKYAGLDATTSVILHTKASATAGDAVVVTWRLNPNIGLASGSYATTTSFTLVANP